MKTRSLFIILLSLFSLNTFANSTLDVLLNKVKDEQVKETQLALEREKEFLSSKDQQQALLAKAKKELASLESVTKNLTSRFETNEKELTELQDKLNIATGTLGEMFGIVKQMSGDFKVQFENSIISAQLKGRDQFISQLASRKELPTIAELRKLWLEILNETNESGKIVKFKANVIEANGKSSEKTVTRVGAFNLASEGKYLVYQGETGQVMELSRQPKSGYLSLIKDLESAEKNEIIKFGLDPSRGALLSMLVNAPDLMERFHQGGLVGYVIFILLIVGLIISTERTLFLNKEKKKMQAQLASKEVLADNSLGKLMKTFDENQNKDIETLELKLEESILKEIPKLDKGIGTLKILAAIGPLMGLLGTVTGMIMTFQTITLFGTGDPKLMAGGISSALITTVQGLLCAIPMLLLHNFVSSKSKSLIQILEEKSAGLLSQKAGR